MIYVVHLHHATFQANYRRYSGFSGLYSGCSVVTYLFHAIQLLLQQDFQADFSEPPRKRRKVNLTIIFF